MDMGRIIVMKLSALFAFLMFSGAISLYEPLVDMHIVVRTTTNNDHFIAQIKNVHQAAFEDGVRWVVQLKPLHFDNLHTFDFDNNETTRDFFIENMNCWGDFEIIYNECYYESGFDLCPLGVDGRIDMEESEIFSC